MYIYNNIYEKAGEDLIFYLKKHCLCILDLAPLTLRSLFLLQSTDGRSMGENNASTQGLRRVAQVMVASEDMHFLFRSFQLAVGRAVGRGGEWSGGVGRG